MIIGTVVEGPTDRLVLEAVLDEILPGEHVYRSIHPGQTFGELGTGWKGVRRWCRQTWQLPDFDLATLVSQQADALLNLLVIHLDADIAFEHDLQASQDVPVSKVQQPCPPVAATVTKLRQVVAHWLMCESMPPRVILAIPAQDTETWTFAALFPDDELCKRDDYECVRSGQNHPGYRLTLKRYGRLLRRKASGIKKSKRVYEQIAPQIVSVWDQVCQICTQAEQFHQDVSDSLMGGEERTPNAQTDL